MSKESFSLIFYYSFQKLILKVVCPLNINRGVMVIVAGYGHGDTSSNPGPDWLNFT